MTREPRRLPITRITIRWRNAPPRLPLLMQTAISLILLVLLVGAAQMRSGPAPLLARVPSPYRRHIRPQAFLVPTFSRHLRDGPIRGLSPNAVPSDDDGHATCPAHVAIIMDGNSRASNNVAYNRGARRTLSTVLYLRSLGVRHVTLYAFSTENWTRSGAEIDLILSVMTEFVGSSMIRNHCGTEGGIIFAPLGDIAGMRSRGDTACRLANTLEELREYSMAVAPDGATVVRLAVNYGGRAEIVQAARRVAEEFGWGSPGAKEVVEDEETFGRAI
eukprot:CAMPEP_0194295334 /NCGR_PEP_ID=MMETSP0169-20130528/53172_1 /TAXON_ID=218684 /ORGANISM="Corethron pennatum, Strain L29A3" /LENGTH=274 /DNA_ID=CAMNT_0039044473 /DNA_START=51 /DNA_END=872 /DNA_ORIENTATION=-